MARAPRFAQGHAVLAINLASLAESMRSDARKEVLARLRSEASEAMRLDPATSGAAYDTLYKTSRLESPGDIVKAEDFLLAGLRADPDDGFLNMRECQLLSGVGGLAEALH